MKHVASITKSLPAKAFLVEGHPALKDSIEGLIADPAGTVALHLNKNNAE